MGADPAKLQRAAVLIAQHPANLAAFTKLPGERGPIDYRLWPDQRIAVESALTYHQSIILKARQLGMTWTLGALLGLWDALRPIDGETLVLSQTEDDARAVIQRARYLYGHLPKELREMVFPLKVDRADRLEVDHGDVVSSLISLSSSSAAGRGRTFRRVICDEQAHWEHADERMAAIMPTVADTGQLVVVSTAKGHNQFRQRYLGAVDPQGQSADEAEALGNGFVRHFFGALSHPNRDHEWVARKRTQLGDLGPQEYPLTAGEAFVASGACVFDTNALAIYLDEVCEQPGHRRKAYQRETLLEEAGGQWQIWQTPQEGRTYVITADPCGGGAGRDSAAAVVCDDRSWDQVAAFHGKVEPLELARQMMAAGTYYNTALLAPESNTHGAGVVATLIDNHYPNLYRRTPTDRFGAGLTAHVGFETTAKSRAEALGFLKDCVRYRDLGIVDAAAVDEMMEFVTLPSGREQAEEGAHDDRVMAWAIMAFVLSNSRLTTGTEYEPMKPYVPRVSSRTGY